MLVYKILRLDAFQLWRATGEAPLSADDERDGYVHLATAAQLEGTLDRHYGATQALGLLGVESGDLGEALRWEPARGGELFPHLYGRLQTRHVVESWVLGRGLDGRYHLPREVR